MAIYLQAHGEYDEAREAFTRSATDMERALELRPDAPTVPAWRFDRGLAHFGLALIEQDGYKHADHAHDEFARAVEDLEFARDGGHRHVDLFVRLGESHLFLTRLAEQAGKDPAPHPDESLRTFDEAVALAPADWRTHNGRAIARLDLLRRALLRGERDVAAIVEAAQRDIEEAIRTGPKQFEVYRLKAEFLFKNLRRPREAIPLYEKALGLLGKPDAQMEADLEAARAIAKQMPEEF